MNVVLIGMMGAGKTSVGKEVAARMNLRWVDTDALIEERHGKISEIFAKCGEEYFRNLESEVAAELAGENGLVISTGGGLILRQENVAKLKTNGKFIYLRARVETLYGRIEFDGTRPLLKSKEEALKALTERLRERASVYERAADEIIDTDELTLNETVKRVIQGAKI